MSYYYLLTILVVLAGFIARYSANLSKMALLFSVASIFMFFAFRIGFTPDYYNYEIDWQDSGLNMIRHEKEVGYQLLVRIIPTYRLALVVQALLFCIAVFYIHWIYIDRRLWWWTLMIMMLCTHVLLGNISAFRSSFVTLACLLAFLIRNRSKAGLIIAFVLVGIASTIHRSGLIMIPFLLLNGKPWYGTRYRVVFFSVLTVIVLSLFFANSLNTLLNSVVDRLGFNDEFEAYYQDSISNTITLGTFTIIRLLLLFSLLVLTLRQTKQLHTPQETLCLKLTTIFLVLNLMPGIGLIARFYNYFAFPCLIGAYAVVRYEKNETFRLAYTGAFLLYSLWELYLLLSASHFRTTYAIYHNTLFGI